MRSIDRAELLQKHHVVIKGSHGPTVVLSHGFGTDQTAWDQVAEKLQERFRLVLFDLVGMTSESSEHYDHHRYGDLQSYAQDLLAVLDAAEVDRCQFVGHSVSGMVGGLASVLAPQRFRKLVMLGASPCYRNFDDYKGGFDQAELDGLFDAMMNSYSKWAKAYAPAVVASPDHPAVAEFSRGLLAMRPDVALSIALTIFRSDHRSMLSTISTPCTLLQAREDVAVPAVVAEYMRDRIPNAVLEVIDAKGHLPHLSAPHLVCEALLRHLDQGV
jgi:sigma-B regulation protein RsbQ